MGIPGLKSCPNGVIGLLCSPQGLLLMRRGPQSKLPDQRGKWAGVGGGVEPGENIEEALCREFEEEVGISIWNLPRRLLGTTNPKAGVQVLHYIIYSSTKMIPKVSPEEQKKVEEPTFFPIGAIPHNECIPDLKLILSKKMDQIALAGTVSDTLGTKIL